jgi:hypothetical protein
MARLDLTNQQFTRLTAIKAVGQDPKGQIQWLCQCDCGKTIIVTAARLRCGNVKSCGCLKRDAAREKQSLAIASVLRDGTSKNICSKVVNSNTGIRGVSYNKMSRKYEAALVLEGQTKFRKSYKTLEEAAAARKEAEEQWFKPLIEKWSYNEGKS